MQLSRGVSFGFKNFQSHMGITSNVTLRGLLRRTARRYPRAWGAVRKGSLLCGIYFVMMSLIPGTSLPLQTHAKLSLLAASRMAAQCWHYSPFSPHPEEYLIKLNEILLKGMEEQIYSLAFLGRYFGEIRQVMVEQRKGLKQNAYLDLLIYSEIVLQNIIRHQKRLLLEAEVYDHFEWVCSTVFERVATVTEREDKHIKLVYSLVQYLLNFAPEGREQKVIECYHRMATGKGVSEQGSFGKKVMRAGLRQPQFTSKLKNIYSTSTDETLRRQIMGIFEALDSLYEQPNQ